MNDVTLETPCWRSPCAGYAPGHHMHFIHAKRVGLSPWGWRDAVVLSVEGQFACLAYLEGDATPVVWHHTSLKRVIGAGDPVRLHEQYYALGCPAGWFNVVVEGGIGAVPEPADKAAWEDQVTGFAVDLATGVALALDHVEERGDGR